jgi:hypothetical protein
MVKWLVLFLVPCTAFGSPTNSSSLLRPTGEWCEELINACDTTLAGNTDCHLPDQVCIFNNDAVWMEAYPETDRSITCPCPALDEFMKSNANVFDIVGDDHCYSKLPVLSSALHLFILEVRGTGFENRFDHPCMGDQNLRVYWKRAGTW